VEAPGVQAARVVKELGRARLAGVKPIEIFAEDFTMPVAQAGEVAVTLHNVLNRRISGIMLLMPPPEIKLTAPALRVNLAAGASERLRFKIASARPNAGNAYLFGYRFTGPDGGAQLDETIHAAVIAHGTPRLDGQLASWSGAMAVTVFGGPNAPRLRQRAWRPWEQNADVAAGMAEVRIMYDDKFLYVAARERNRNWRPKPRLTTRDDDALFGKGETAQTYIGDAYAAVAGRGSCLQLLLGLGLHQRGLPEASWAPARMLADDDTDYEYDIWGAPDGSSELARTMAPQLGFFNFLPRCEPVGYNPVPAGATALVRRAGDDVIYQAAIPLTDIEGIAARPGATVKLGFRLPGTGIDEGEGRSPTRANSLSALPTWEASASNELVWGFGP
jgi:hypothetical protein